MSFSSLSRISSAASAPPPPTLFWELLGHAVEAQSLLERLQQQLGLVLQVEVLDRPK